MRAMRNLAIAILCGVLAACGGDDDGSGVDSDKPLSEATVEDATAFCEYIDDLGDPEANQKIECYVEGIFGEQQGQGDCQAIADDCLAEPIEEDDLDDCSDIDEEDLDDLPACASEVTFGEYESCAEAMLSRNANIASEISCDSDLENLGDVDLPPACQQVQDECPDLLDT